MDLLALSLVATYVVVGILLILDSLLSWDRGDPSSRAEPFTKALAWVLSPLTILVVIVVVLYPRLHLKDG